MPMWIKWEVSASTKLSPRYHNAPFVVMETGTAPRITDRSRPRCVVDTIHERAENLTRFLVIFRSLSGLTQKVT